VRRARRIHHGFKEQKQSIKDKEKKKRQEAFVFLLEMSFFSMFGDFNIVLIYLDQTAYRLIQFPWPQAKQRRLRLTGTASFSSPTPKLKMILPILLRTISIL
jgi:hypothetical protein